MASRLYNTRIINSARDAHAIATPALPLYGSRLGPPHSMGPDSVIPFLWVQAQFYLPFVGQSSKGTSSPAQNRVMPRLWLVLFALFEQVVIPPIPSSFPGYPSRGCRGPNPITSYFKIVFLSFWSRVSFAARPPTSYNLIKFNIV